MQILICIEALLFNLVSNSVVCPFEMVRRIDLQFIIVTDSVRYERDLTCTIYSFGVLMLMVGAHGSNGRLVALLDLVIHFQFLQIVVGLISARLKRTAWFATLIDESVTDWLLVGYWIR